MTKEIAAELGLSVGTVSTYCTEAIRILGARDRRDAAEQLHRHEAMHPVGDSTDPTGRNTPPRGPSGVEPLSEGVDPPRPDAAPRPAPDGAAELMRLLPLRRREAADNDLTVLQRLQIIVLLALFIAIGFGAVASGLRVVNDLVRSVGR